ncbi:hypothetical protein K443DRAFT_117494 [Laccaria amethystina LaAM-08-1]|uniref:Uncharacterized protein n=1 Tax=Laccaria amethystina LaAM-08-1 TaxID=1095629 RepID=A0A0C9WWV1_9AGAR|nr:hypothetical protein K443DRAFT_117494 [Laccaria amethystina LaAM-08-1]
MFVICCKSKYSSDMVHPSSIYVFSISKFFCKSCISPEYSNCDNSQFSPSNIVLQLLRATR